MTNAANRSNLYPKVLEEVVRYIEWHSAPDARKQDCIKRIRDRWALEIVKDVIEPVRKKHADEVAEKIIWQVISALAYASLCSEKLAEARSEGTRRIGEIDEEICDALEKVEKLLVERERLAKDGARGSDLFDTFELFEKLSENYPEWFFVTGFDRMMIAMRTTSKPAPTFLQLVQTGLLAWPYDERFNSDRGDSRTAAAHEVLRILEPIEALTHGQRAVLINVALGSQEHTSNSVKQLLARKRRLEQKMRNDFFRESANSIPVDNEEK